MLKNKQTYYSFFRIYYEDTDFSGSVYHARYLNFFERARTELLRLQGLFQKQINDEEHISFVVHSLAIKYLKPAKMDDLICVFTEVKEIKNASFKMVQRIFRFTDNNLEAVLATACEKIPNCKKISNKLLNTQKILLTTANITLAVINWENKVQRIPNKIKLLLDSEG